MEAYTNQILELMTRNKGQQALIIGGGIANFTDVKKTFAVVIKAFEKNKEKMKDVRVYVRRAGPRDTEGLKALQAACDEMGIWCTTNGAEMPMTEVVGMAVKDLNISP